MILKQKAQDIAKAFTKWGLWQGGSTPSPEVLGIEFEITTLYENLTEGWTSGSIEIPENAENYVFMSVELGNQSDGGYHSIGSGGHLISVQSMLNIGQQNISSWFKRYFVFKVDETNHKILTIIERGASDEPSGFTPRAYRILGYKLKSKVNVE